MAINITHTLSIILFVAVLLFPAFTYSEVITLKSGEKVEGKITERTNEYIKMDFYGVSLTYFLDEIKDVDGEKVSFSTQNKEALQEQKITPSGDEKTQFVPPAQKKAEHSQAFDKAIEIADENQHVRTKNTLEILLRSLTAEVEIPNDVKYVRLKFDDCVEILKKITEVNYEEYFVTCPFFLPYKRSGRAVTTPQNTCLVGGLCPTDDDKVVEFLRLFAKGEHVAIRTKENREVMSKIDRVKFSAAILPSNFLIRGILEKVRQGEIITVTGILFRYIGYEHKGKKGPLAKCLVNSKVLYVSEVFP